MHQNLIPGLVFAFVVGSTSLAAAGVGPAAGRGAVVTPGAEFTLLSMS
jgi:hypothetical protein